MKRKGNYYTAPVTNARLAAQWAAARWPSPPSWLRRFSGRERGVRV